MGLSIYLIVGALLVGPYLGWISWRDYRYRQILQQNIAAGLTEPASLHPVIDPVTCIGCGSCVAACPEQASHPVLGIIGGKAALIEPTSCIGHGACKAACPVNAITLVFGTETRGVDIPNVNAEFETNVKGVFVAGELGGMGLIRNAIEQGRQAMDAIAVRKAKSPTALDVVIVGAGPAGFSASLRAKELGLNFVTLEQGSLGGAVFQFPRGKIVMTTPVNLPIIGKVQIRETSKEALLEFWQDIESKTGLCVNYQESVKTIEPVGNDLVVTTDSGEYQCANVLLAIGRRGMPRKLGVPGEGQAKVVYRLIDPEQYRGQQVLVVGGGDSALEAALSISEEANTSVTLSYRGDAFGRAKPANRQRIEHAESAGSLNVLLRSNVKAIEASSILVEQDNEIHELPNDAVIISVGGILPTAFLKSVGIDVETKYGTA